MAIVIGSGITVGPGIIIGPTPVLPVFLITEDNNQLITETGDNFIEEQYE
jgi:hypothetical protein